MCALLWILWSFPVRILFFFFKQKTAYEMRISDWSSDVCSSDLRVLAARRERPCGRVRPTWKARGWLDVRGCTSSLRVDCSIRCEIGRASCRERVCQYV